MVLYHNRCWRIIIIILYITILYSGYSTIVYTHALYIKKYMELPVSTNGTPKAMDFSLIERIIITGAEFAASSTRYNINTLLLFFSIPYEYNMITMV